VLEALTEIRVKRPELLMAVLTNKPVNPSREICDALGLSTFFFQNYGGNSFDSKKPDPTGLLTIMRESAGVLDGGRPAAAIRPNEVVMIGDSDVDVLTAKRCGAHSIGCGFGLAPTTLAAAVPDLIVDHPSEWPAALGI
jgi:phosphoglycolate phosphatase